MPDIVLEKIPPQNLDAEMAVLGSMLIDEQAISVAVESIDSAAFYNNIHRKIYEAILELYNANKAVDLITLSNELKRKEQLEVIGGAAFLTSLANAVPTSANIDHYVSIVKEKNILRNLINNSTKIVSYCYESESNVSEVVDYAEKLIFEISEKRGQGSYQHLKEIIKQSIEKIDRLYQKKTHVTGVSTGIND